MARLDYSMEPIFFTPPRTKLDKALYKGSPSPAPAPTSQTVTSTSIPEYARPYVERMLGKSEALTDVNANPYQTYGGQRIAEFSPLQQQAFSNVANMQTAGQLGAGTALSGASGLGALGTAGQMAGAGQQYNRMATSPSATQAFMNPYLQASLQPQLAEIGRQYGISGTQQQGQATQAGAFGGTREALMAAENQRNKNMAMNQAIGQGYNTAFQNAQQAQQFGANLGLQGLQGALSGYGQANAAAGTLGQLGQTQFGQQQAINAAQQNVGTIQQAQAQQNLDQRYQDFLKQQNYPYQQLAFMSDMARGLPLSQSATSMYQAPPSMASQLGGLGMAGLGIYGATGGFKAAKGGEIKDHSYAAGGKINLKSEEELREIITNPTSNPLEVASAEEQLMLRNRMKNNPQTAAIMGMDQPRAGIASIATGDMVPEEAAMAGGGIVAFKTGNTVKSKVPIPTNIESYLDKLQKDYDTELTNLQGEQFGKSQAQQQAIQDEMKARQERAPYMALANAGFGAMAGTSPFALTNFGQGAQSGLASYEKSNAEDSADRKLLLQQQVEQEKAEFARRAQLAGMKQGSITNLMNKELGLQQIKASQAGTSAQKDLANYTKLAAVRESAIKNRIAQIIAERKISTFDAQMNWQPLEAQAIADVDARFAKIPMFQQVLNLEVPKTKDTANPNAKKAAPAVAAPAVSAAPVASKPVKSYDWVNGKLVPKS